MGSARMIRRRRIVPRVPHMSTAASRFTSIIPTSLRLHRCDPGAAGYSTDRGAARVPGPGRGLVSAT